MRTFFSSEIPKKVCKRCEEEKNVHEFPRNRSHDGHANTCKLCCKKIQGKSINKILSENSTEKVPYRLF